MCPCDYIMHEKLNRWCVHFVFIDSKVTQWLGGVPPDLLGEASPPMLRIRAESDFALPGSPRLKHNQPSSQLPAWKMRKTQGVGNFGLELRAMDSSIAISWRSFLEDPHLQRLWMALISQHGKFDIFSSCRRWSKGMRNGTGNLGDAHVERELADTFETGQTVCCWPWNCKDVQRFY